MSTPMNPLDEKLCEQLCAYMDGELPPDEARFLERRLASEAELQAKWLRLQLASSCLKRQPFQPMVAGLRARVADSLAAPDVVANAGRPWRLWAIAASVALLALVFAPRMIQQQGNGPEAVATHSLAAMPASAVPVASPSSADFVATTVASAAATDTRPRAAMVEPTVALPDVAPTSPAIVAMDVQDLAAVSDSPADFPLVESGATKAWPRAELPGATNDPSIEAYLVRHNQMLTNDGLGGFVPYVDVVTNPGDKQ